MEDIAAPLQHALGDEYRLIRELGGGGMSQVFLAEETSLGRQVVVKVLPPEITSEASIARFKREAAITARIQHPNILPVLAFGARDGLLYYVTPFVAGESLRHRLERTGPLPVEEAVQLAREVADALAAAHAHGVVHRDIKPENIFLSNGHAVLGDFGIARGLEAEEDVPITHGTRLTAAGQSMGTPGYMSPEQAAGDDTVDARSDIYSLAVVAYELLAGVPPFTGRSARAVMAAHLNQTPKPVTEYRRDVPVTVSNALDRALAKEPARRFASAAEFRDALAGRGGMATRFAWSRRSRSLAIAAGIAVLAMLGVAGWLFTTRHTDAVLDENLVAIAPFDVFDPSVQMWKEGIVDILSANLDDAGPLRTVPPTVVVRRWNGRSDAPSAAKLGRAVGARYTIYGRFVGAGADSVRATATLLDVATNESMGGDIEVRDLSTRLDRVADSLTILILQRFSHTRPIAAVRTASIGTSSLPAIKAFLQAEQFYRRSEWDSANAYYRVAIAADSMFAPALRHLSNALSWTHAADRAELERRYEYAFLAGQRNHGLTPRESLLVAADSNFAALQVLLAGGATLERSPLPYSKELFATLDEGSRRFPDDPEIWHKLADAHYHYLMFEPGIEYADARREFDRSIALDSAFAPSYLHMPDLALRAQDPAAALRYVNRYLRLEPEGSAAGYMRMLRLFLDPATASRVPVDSLVRTSTVADVGELFNILLSWMDLDESSIRVARALPKLPPGPADSLMLVKEAPQALAVALLARGHLAETARNANALPWGAIAQLALLGAIPADSADRRLAEAASSGRVAAMVPTLRWWAERGDTTTLRAIAARLDTSAVRPGFEEYTRAVRAAVQAHIELARGDTAAAVRGFDAVPDSICFFEGCYAVWYTKAQLLSAVGRDRDAMRVLDHEYPSVDATRALWRYERAKVAERLGDGAKAARDYAYVAAAFEHADSSLQPMVHDSRAALARLGSEAR
jgi:serine/threonine-protein kinase